MGPRRGTWKGVEVLREHGLKKKAEAKLPPDTGWP